MKVFIKIVLEINLFLGVLVVYSFISYLLLQGNIQYTGFYTQESVGTGLRCEYRGQTLFEMRGNAVILPLSPYLYVNTVLEFRVQQQNNVS